MEVNLIVLFFYWLIRDLRVKWSELMGKRRRVDNE